MDRHQKRCLAYIENILSRIKGGEIEFDSIEVQAHTRTISDGLISGLEHTGYETIIFITRPKQETENEIYTS
ncbi:MAG: hypothetical protein KKC55_14835 [Gammaproteobacteria bacterium]|uniref:Uncharacterized protein n=1 Tax=viral metagenome TaxID=1070528 RepID=A0A6M3X663_9ZZZZ|nr:hypothetical protein [Gammaproteobacteria bacterium]